MENHQKTSFTFEIDNFSEKKYVIASPIFIIGQCQWFVKVYTNGYFNKDHVSVYLHVANPQSLRPGWKRRVNYSFILFNQSGKELKRTPESCDLFCTEVSAWGYPKLLPLSKLKEEGFLENDKLTIKVEVKVVEVVHVGEVTGKEMVDFKGFHVLYTQLSSVSLIFAEHPDIAVDFRPKSKLVKTAYMNVLLSLIETLNKPPQILLDTELRDTHSNLSELTEAGFKLGWLWKKLDEVSMKRKKEDAGWFRVQQSKEAVKNFEVSLKGRKRDDADGSRLQQLEERLKNLELMELDCLKSKLEEVSLENKKEDADLSRLQQLEERLMNLELMELDCLKSKLEEVSLENKKANADWSRVQQLEERVKNFELMELDFKLDSLKSNLEEVSLERKKSDDADGFRVQKIEERVKNLELMELDFKLDSLKSNLEEVSLERKKSDEADGSRVRKIEERVKNLELMELDCLKSKLEEVSLERKKSDDADRSRVQQIEECFKNLELMVLDLKVELDKNKDKSCDDGFLLIDEFA
ncbi:MATH/TRAF domain [Arabidopsis suecica]|uniref:MATH/TRAF domain n=1 Tax=Arabidopsis suecica TaxID=45249 RepID=A0A8T2ANW5_ARASU|nr:MATH/TRAF domain [Arabidopsis suecica]